MNTEIRFLKECKLQMTAFGYFGIFSLLVCYFNWNENNYCKMVLCAVDLDKKRLQFITTAMCGGRHTTYYKP